MSENKRPLKVFLSHAHSDADAVRALYDRLTADGIDTWLDKEKLLPGQDWELEIRRAVREADVVVVCLSKVFNQRGYRQKEVRIALNEADMMPEGEIFIIPARLEECDNLESLRKKWHWVDLFKPDGYEKLMSALQSLSGQKHDFHRKQKDEEETIKNPKKEKKQEIHQRGKYNISINNSRDFSIGDSFEGRRSDDN